MSNKYFLTILITLLVFSQYSYVVQAQASVDDWTSAIFVGLFGQLPNACSGGIANPQCVQCIGYLKLTPLVFFFAIFFLVFYFVVRQMVPLRRGRGGEAEPGEVSGIELRLVGAIAFVLALVFLHAPQVQDSLTQMIFWLMVALIFFGVFVTVGMIRHAPALWLLFGIVVGFVLLVFVWPYVATLLNSWQTFCS